MKSKLHIAFLIALLFVSVLFTACGSEELRYNVKNIKFVNDNGPNIREYELTNSEINEFLDALTDIDFSQYDILPEDRYGEELGVGGGITVYIDTDDESRRLFFYHPYLSIDGCMYIVGDLDIFEFVHRITDEHTLFFIGTEIYQE